MAAVSHNSGCPGTPGGEAGCSPALVGADGQVGGVGQPRGRVRLMDGPSGKVQQITSLKGGKEGGEGVNKDSFSLLYVLQRQT